MRRANDSWKRFENVAEQTGDKGKGGFTRVAITEGVEGQERIQHVCGVTDDGHLWHTVRQDDESWLSFRDVGSQAGNPGKFADVGNAGVNLRTLRVSAPTKDGQLWHSARYVDESWAPFGNVQGQSHCGDFVTISVAGIANQS
jgi:hypothetical protein